MKEKRLAALNPDAKNIYCAVEAGKRKKYKQALLYFKKLKKLNNYFLPEINKLINNQNSTEKNEKSFNFKKNEKLYRKFFMDS